MQARNAERIRFIFNEPALLLDSSLVVSDLHLGTEQALAKNSPSFSGSTERMLSRLLNVAKKSAPKKIILLGDVLHSPIVKADNELSFALMDFFAKLNSDVKTEVVPGNLDSGIGLLEKIGVKMHPASGIISNGIALTHGHLPFPDSFFSCGKIICSQEHFSKKPSASWQSAGIREDEMKKSRKNFNPHLEIVLVPHFNPQIGLLKIRREEMEIRETTEYNLFKLDDANAHSLQGAFIGNARALRGAFDGR